VHTAPLLVGLLLPLGCDASPPSTVDPQTVRKVYLVQANHLDLGFSDLATRVLNRYMVGGPGTADPDHSDAPCVYDSFLGSAATTAAKLRAEGGGAGAPRLRYMADSWVLDVFRDCPADFPSVGSPWDATGLVCPNASLSATVSAAVKRGDIWMHAFPHNAQAELMDRAMFLAGVTRSQGTASAMGSPHKPRVLSQRDVPGLTRGVVPLLRGAGVIGISVGANDDSPAPDTPSTRQCDRLGLHVVRTPFLWVDASSGESIIADVHPGGYGGLTGNYQPPGDSMDGALCDCVGVVGLDEVLCYAWRGDNYGPAQIDEVHTDYRIFGSLFPNAVVEASALDQFFGKIDGNATLRAALPRLGSELGDSWIYGAASDPLKLAMMRAMMRAHSACHRANRCTSAHEPGIAKFQQYALKLAEHTWGGSTGAHMNISSEEVSDVWTVDQMASAAQSNGTFRYIEKLQASWDEQRLYIDSALASLAATSTGTRPPHPTSALAAEIRSEFMAISAPAPTAQSLLKIGMVPVPKALWESPMMLSDDITNGTRSSRNVTVAFDAATAALTTLTDHLGRNWASENNQIGSFAFRSHSFEEWRNYMNSYSYHHAGQHPHVPSGRAADVNCSVMNRCHTQSGVWSYPITGMWKNSSAVVVELTAPAKLLQSGYGAPLSAFLTVKAAVQKGDGVVEVELVWVGKQPSRLHESLYFGMHPLLNSSSTANRKSSQDYEKDWLLLIDKLGSEIDASDVVTGGGSAVHGLDPSGAVKFRPVSHAAPSLVIESLDAGLVLPGGIQNVWNFSAFYRDNSTSSMVRPRDGVHFSLSNNGYWTNYILWYPWRRQDSSSRFRFKIRVARPDNAQRAPTAQAHLQNLL
jgi:hypothetical protein